MVDGWLVYSRADYEKNRAFAGRFLADCGKYGLGIRLVFCEEIGFALYGGCLAASPDASLPAFAINRTRDWLIGRRLEQAGCRVFNCSETSRICNNKIESHLLAARLGLPQVDMVFCPNHPDAVIRHGLGYPVVVKSPFGHGGNEVCLARDEGQLLAFSSQLQCDSVLLQRLCGRPGEDVRVYVLGGRLLAAVRRRSMSPDFRANLSLGGSVEPYELNSDEARLVGRILAALPLDYVGIDFLMDENGGLLFNELEDPVGSRSLYLMGLCDTADLYMEHISSIMNR